MVQQILIKKKKLENKLIIVYECNMDISKLQEGNFIK